MNNPLPCNYAVIRFLPYPETEEFVNLGVALVCPRVGYFGFKLETKRRERITDFFPELNRDVFTRAKVQFAQELRRIRTVIQPTASGDKEPFLLDEQVKLCNDIFRELTRPRESVFRFSNIGTAMADDPSEELARLFAYYVERQFAKHVDFQEKVMERRLQNVFRANQIVRYVADKLGDDDYHVSFPFVCRLGEAHRDTRAVKPLYLDQADSTRLIEHGERWVLRMQHLRRMDYRPECFLFPVQMPTEPKREKHARTICAELSNIGVAILPSADTNDILRFAAG